MTAAIARVNALDREAFVTLLGSLYEHSPWAAERAFAGKPFESGEMLVRALAATVDEASETEQLALIRAHPELAGERLRARALTESSMAEQAEVGLDRLGAAEIKEWAKLNAAYRRRFGFPFVICVRKHTKDQIVAAMKRRLSGSPEAEREEAIRQIHQIAELRLHDLLARLA